VTYRFGIDFVSKEGTGRAYFGSALGGSTYGSVSTVGSHSNVFRAGSDKLFVSLGDAAGGAAVNKFDNIYVEAVDLDRSGKGNHAPVSGVLTRTPMGNSDAVGYAGAGNVEIPTELTQVGTGDFCITGVVQLNANANQLLFGQSQRNPNIPNGNWTYASGLYLTLNYTGNNNHAMNVYLSQADAQGNRIAYNSAGTGSVYKSGQLLAVSVTRRGDLVQIMVNGEVVVTASGFGAIDVQPTLPAFIREPFNANSAQPMRDIRWHKGHAPSNDELREIARADLAKQNGPTTMRGVVKKAYNVTKDRVTGLVHVGNNGGRSTFAYPLLVDESSDAALNAIAAHDGMILEN